MCTGRIENKTLLHIQMSAHCSVLVQLAFISSLLRMESFLFCVCVEYFASGALPSKRRTDGLQVAQTVPSVGH